ncbi:bifunctional [glutamine synthetase] adenylyltransferase/[glutamine synthetase]-adenylyl-L-tyrosine phosphorylase [Nitriliruptor alkaliphilus]|uniref:bifunctional [glutamine synthetase] adenylyltransferase/[glutamine synthetase]-adenylyl-L-tyrosine phosphorylase n=1 Tax=Nitriliruptor alkaliphilus TaxID=427918 RepID=UPI000695E46D|nr:bifunctional [glutamine synthetase] adenylyltransferase/[glutamine synthetase]-adenylyl-L-tyrosine phosphorylase [Nitriliruptor alkaliphilus]
MTRSVSLRARLAKAGLDADQALPWLEEAGLAWEGGVDEHLLGLVSTAADPQDALRCVAELAIHAPSLLDEVRADEAWLERVIAVGGTSRPLGDLLARYADAVYALRTLDGVDVSRTADAVEQAVLDAETPADEAAAVAAIRRAATADIAGRDLTRVDDVEAVARELANLAEAVLTGTLAALHRQHVGDGQPAARIGVIGMGKLGGRELNYVSDVDVVFVHEPTVEGEDEAAAREAKAVLSRLMELLNASTTMGRAYEIDPTLRPEGRRGPLSRRVASFQAYWERWAKTWEFQALLKARPVAGDRDLCAELLAAAEPFVWPEELDPGVVAEVRAMKARIESKPEVQRHGERQLKLGPGGIRDVEFAVQLLQIVHGRVDRTLRATGTLPALAALSRGGYVADEDAAAFGEAYRLLRTVEHRLQLAHERRTHTIPDDPDRQEWLARAMGYRPADGEPARTAFHRDLSRTQARVRELHAKLFFRPLLESYAAVSADAAGVSLPTEVRLMGEDAARERLTALGFTDGTAALRHVRHLTAGVSRRARTVRAVLPAVLSALEETPDPNGGLASFRDLVDAQGERAELLNHLRDHPPSAELLGRLLGTSKVAGELLAGQPGGVGWLREDEARREPRTRDELTRMALARLTWQDTNSALRRFKRFELLRLVVRDLAGLTSVSGVGEELTALGEACLEGALSDVLRRRCRELGLDGPDELPVRLAIVGMGKFGGLELNYASDLDVLFVHEVVPGADEAKAGKLALDIGAEVMRSLSAITPDGTAFEVDADLRPEGRSGPLSRSLASYEAYWERWSEPWEHQALLKARHVAGDADLGQRLVEASRPLAYPQDFDDRAATRVRRMKARLERERIPKRVDPERHIKLGPGGLSDVEWTVQLLQQRHGATSVAARGTSTMGVLDAMQDADLLEHRDAAWLREGFRFLSELRNRRYLLRHRDVDVVPQQTHTLETLARAMGYGRGGWQELEEDRRRHARHVRRVCLRLFYEQDGGEGW